MARHADTEMTVMKKEVLYSHIPRNRRHSMPCRDTWGIIKISHGVREWPRAFTVVFMGRLSRFRIEGIFLTIDHKF